MIIKIIIKIIIKTIIKIIIKIIIIDNGGSHVPLSSCPFLLFTSEGDVKWGTKRDKRGQKGTKIRNQIL